MKWLIVIGLLAIGVIAYRRFQSTKAVDDQKSMQAWAGAFWGGLIGCFFGIAGFGGAIVATIPGAVIGYFLLPLFLQSRQSEPTGYSQEPDPTALDTTHDQDARVQPLPGSYYELVEYLRYSTKEGYIFSVTAHQAFAPDETVVRADENTEKRMDAELAWWYEGDPRRWHVFLKNHSVSPIRFLRLHITPGPAHSPTGPTNCVYIKLHSDIPPGFPFVAVFPTPKGSVDTLAVQDCSLHSIYQVAP